MKRINGGKLFVSIYVVALQGSALCDPKDGHLLAFGDWGDASTAASGVGLVMTWPEFLRRGLLEKMPIKPGALRLRVRWGKRTVTYGAGLDVAMDELRVPQKFSALDEAQRPRYVERKREQAKIWEEKVE